jgi:hypothetical protein
MRLALLCPALQLHHHTTEQLFLFVLLQDSNGFGTKVVLRILALCIACHQCTLLSFACALAMLDLLLSLLVEKSVGNNSFHCVN